MDMTLNHFPLPAILINYFSKIRHMIIFPSPLDFPSSLFPRGALIEVLYMFLFFHIWYMCPAHRNHMDFAVIIFVQICETVVILQYLGFRESGMEH